MSNYTRVYFEGLGIDFDLPSVAFSIGSYDVHWYGIIIAFGFALAVLYGGRMAYKWRMSLDGMTDVLIWGTIFGIICARAYYVIFEWSYYKDHLAEIPQIWNGGIAIYGGIIGAIIGAWIGCKIGKINFPNLLDLGALGLLIGQGIGRWGNFFNQEAFGTNTSTAPFRMWSLKIHDTLEASSQLLAEKGIEVNPDMPVHPTFLYESVWCILGFFILNYIVHKHRHFKGEIFMLYGVWYGLERVIVEGMRTDSLYIANTTLRVSQLLSMIIVAVFLIAYIVCFVKYKKGTLFKALVIDDAKKITEVQNGTDN
ncbi:MAG: prolipoprotein diacylglyceryl transferase [Eubacterium sp.]